MQQPFRRTGRGTFSVPSHDQRVRRRVGRPGRFAGATNLPGRRGDRRRLLHGRRQTVVRRAGQASAERFVCTSTDVLGRGIAIAPAQSRAIGPDAAHPARPERRSGALPRDADQLLDPAIAAQHPDIATYSGVGVDDPSLFTTFDLTPNGLHATVLSKNGDWQIAPLTEYAPTVRAGGGDYAVFQSGTTTPIDSPRRRMTMAMIMPNTPQRAHRASTRIGPDRIAGHGADALQHAHRDRRDGRVDRRSWRDGECGAGEDRQQPELRQRRLQSRSKRRIHARQQHEPHLHRPRDRPVHQQRYDRDAGSKPDDAR